MQGTRRGHGRGAEEKGKRKKVEKGKWGDKWFTTGAGKRESEVQEEKKGKEYGRG